MLSNRICAATIPAMDIGRARDWYDEKLGLQPDSESPAGMVYALAGSSGFLLYPTGAAGQAPNTLMTFESGDVEADVAALKGRGVVFEEYDGPGLVTVHSVATMGPNMKAAWFRDSEGNILAIGNRPG